MKNNWYFIILIAFLAVNCQQEVRKPDANSSTSGFSLLIEPNPEWQYGDLTLVPIVAEDAFVAQNKAVAAYKTLGEALDMRGFKIIEKQPYGRFEDTRAINTITIQNKTQDTIFLMAGDIVQGGNQDRVIAQDMLVLPRTLCDAPVFCVEPNRWTPHANEEGQQIFAFTGYYHVASGSIRKAAAFEGNQQSVWNQVGRITALHDATSNSGTYAALEQSKDYTRQRDEYLRFFGDKFAELPNIVGIVALKDNKLLAADLFGHPALFKKQYAALLHSYVTDGLTKVEDEAGNESVQLSTFEQTLAFRLAHAKQGKLMSAESLVHFMSL